MSRTISGKLGKMAKVLTADSVTALHHGLSPGHQYSLDLVLTGSQGISFSYSYYSASHSSRFLRQIPASELRRLLMYLQRL